MRLGSALALLIVAAYCLFGIAATFEPMDPTKQWTWRIVYAIVGLGCLATIAWNAWRRK
jgi:hypothetical protein